MNCDHLKCKTAEWQYEVDPVQYLVPFHVPDTV